MGEFYVVLSSSDAEGTTGDFEVHLPRRLRFDRDHLVGLTEFSFVRSWETINSMLDGCIFFDCGGFVRGLRVPTGQYDDTANLIEHINKSITEMRSCPAGTTGQLREKYHDFELWEKEVKRRKTKTDKKGPTYDGTRFFFDKNRVQITRPAHVRAIWFAPCLRVLLGLANTQWFDRQDEITGATAPDSTGGVSLLYIYSQLVAPRIVSTSDVSLLRAVSIKPAPLSSRQVVTFNSPQYVPIDIETCDKIHIQIRNSFGEIVHFTSGNVLLTLHIKHRPLFA